MFGFLFATFLLVVALLTITLRKTYYYLPPNELKRQAEHGDKLANSLYRAVAYGPSLRVLLWLIIALSSAGGLVLLSRQAPPLLAFVLVAVLLWLAFSWVPNTRVTIVGARLSALFTPVIASLLGYLHPALSHAAKPLHNRYQATDHTGLYETDDLLELVEKQKSQVDNRVPASQLQAITRALTASRYKVRDMLIPRSDVKTISDDDTIGLVLLDELHASKQSSFPVVHGKTDKVVGALYLHDIGLKTEGRVSDFMHHRIRYLHEEDSLAQALQAFFKTKQQLFVVVNSFEEYVGIITLEHVVRQLSGEMKVDDFDQHEDLAAVANKHAHDNELEEKETEIADNEPEPDEVSVPEPQDEVAKSEPALTDPEPEIEIITDEPIDETSEPFEDTEEADEIKESEAEPVADNPAEEAEGATNIIDPDNLAALDLPEEDDVVGSHITFEKPKTKKSKTKSDKSQDEVVE